MSTTYSIPSYYPITSSTNSSLVPSFSVAATGSTFNYTQPSALEIGSNGKLVVRIHMDGSVEYGEQVSVNEAAKEFWDRVGPTRHALNEEIRLRDKYPALQSAWDHYQIVLKMCQSEDENGSSD